MELRFFVSAPIFHFAKITLGIILHKHLPLPKKDFFHEV